MEGGNIQRNKYRFRLLYAILTDQQLIAQHGPSIPFYQRHNYCPKPKLNQTVQGFFMVPDALRPILVPHAKRFQILDRPEPPPKIVSEDTQLFTFQLLYFICRDKALIRPDVHMTQAYQERKECDHRIKNDTFKRDFKGEPILVPYQTTEAFFAVPEYLYWILAPYASFFHIQDRAAILI